MGGAKCCAPVLTGQCRYAWCVVAVCGIGEQGRSGHGRWITLHSSALHSSEDGGREGPVAHKSLAAIGSGLWFSGPMPCVWVVHGAGEACGDHGLRCALVVKGLVDWPKSAIFASASAYGRAQEPWSSQTKGNGRWVYALFGWIVERRTASIGSVAHQGSFMLATGAMLGRWSRAHGRGEDALSGIGQRCGLWPGPLPMVAHKSLAATRSRSMASGPMPTVDD
jgi:hypothetical protein